MTPQEALIRSHTVNLKHFWGPQRVKELCAITGITIGELGCFLGMTPSAFRSALEKRSLHGSTLVLLQKFEDDIFRCVLGEVREELPHPLTRILSFISTLKQIASGNSDDPKGDAQQAISNYEKDFQ